MSDDDKDDYNGNNGGKQYNPKYNNGDNDDNYCFVIALLMIRHLLI